MKSPLELGEILKTEREKQKIELAELSIRTGLPEKYLVALERGTHDELPGRAYARIYYLNCARALKLDTESLMLEWPQPVSRVPQMGQGVPARKGTAFVWLGLPLVALALWGIFRGTATISERAVGTEVPVETSEDLFSDRAADLDGPAEGDSLSSVLPAAGVIDSTGDSVAAAPAPPVEAPVRHRLTLRARAASEVVIKADGVPVEDLVLKPGEEVEAEATVDFVLTVTSPESMDATLDGEPLVLPDRGRRALVDHRIELNPQKEGP
jgi:hypothetical protein